MAVLAYSVGYLVCTVATCTELLVVVAWIGQQGPCLFKGFSVFIVGLITLDCGFETL